MPDLNRTQNFADGDLVTAQKLKDLIDLTTIQPYFLTSKSYLFQDTLNASTDRLLAYKASTNSFMQITMKDLFQGANMTNGVKYWEYEGGSEYGKTLLFSRSPTSNVYCGIFMDTTGGSSGQSVSDPKWGSLDISNGSIIQYIAGSQFFEGSSINFKAGWPYSRATNSNNGGSYSFIANRTVENFNNRWDLEFSSDAAGYGSALSSEFKIVKTFDKHGTDGYQSTALGNKEVKAFSIRQKVVDGKSTDAVEVSVLDELTVPVVNSTTVNATDFKKSGASTIFPIKRGYSEYEWGSDTTAYVAVTDTVFNSGFNWTNSFKVNAVASGGVLLWETTNAFSLLANEVMFLSVEIWHDELSTNAAATMDYRLRLKTKTVGGATYPTKEIAVRRHQIPYNGATANHRSVFKIERSDFPTGAEDVTRQLQIQLTEGNAHISYKHFIVRATAEVWNKNDIAAGTSALL